MQAKKNIKQIERQSKKQKGNKASSIAFESEELDADFDFEVGILCNWRIICSDVHASFLLN